MKRLLTNCCAYYFHVSVSPSFVELLFLTIANICVVDTRPYLTAAGLHNAGCNGFGILHKLSVDLNLIEKLEYLLTQAIHNPTIVFVAGQDIFCHRLDDGSC